MNDTDTAVFGYCPECGAKGTHREKRPDGADTCEAGHMYRSSSARVMPPHKHEILQHFTYVHLPQYLQDVSRPFSHMANKLALQYPPSAELTVALRKLLEGKDAAVRAAVAFEKEGGWPAYNDAMREKNNAS